MEALELFLRDNLWLLGGAMLLSVGSLLMLPFIVIMLPVDYFLPDRRRGLLREGQHLLLGYLILILKNLLGLLLLLLGAVMLLLPGQGLLTMVVGLMLMDFPGKYRFERTLVRRGKVLNGLNWLRARRGQEPLLPPPPEEAPR
jgi:hypothetical protein